MTESRIARDREVLATRIISLCTKTHGSDYFPGWEYSLWACVLGKEKLSAVDFPDMAELLSLARAASGWFVYSEDCYKFVPMQDWLRDFRTGYTNVT